MMCGPPGPPPASLPIACLGAPLRYVPIRCFGFPALLFPIDLRKSFRATVQLRRSAFSFVSPRSNHRTAKWLRYGFSFFVPFARSRCYMHRSRLFSCGVRTLAVTHNIRPFIHLTSSASLWLQPAPARFFLYLLFFFPLF